MQVSRVLTNWKIFLHNLGVNRMVSHYVSTQKLCQSIDIMCMFSECENYIKIAKIRVDIGRNVDSIPVINL